MIRLIIFDFSGTLAHYDPAGRPRVFEKLREFNLPIDETKALAALDEVLPEYFSQARNWQEVADKITRKLGLVLEADRRESLAAFLEKKAAFKLFDDTRDIFALPQKKAILTLCEKFAIDSMPELRQFEVFSPGVCGVGKPELKAFLAVLEKVQANPEETVMVGDSLENDILPALAIGMKAVLIDRSGSIKIDDPAIIKISTLKELKKHL
jgi:HAD superfamily hydrolase (TIGR01549 family)